MVLSTLGTKMRTHCVGRYLIDLPESLEITSGSEVDLYYGLTNEFKKITVKVVGRYDSPNAFQNLVGKRRAELIADHHFNSPTKNMLAMESQVEKQISLLRAYDDASLVDAWVSTVYFVRGSAVATASAQVYKTEQPEKAEVRLLQAAQRTKAVGDIAVATRGACVGSIVVDAAQDGEVHDISFTSKEVRDLIFTIYMNSMVVKSDGGLLARRAANSNVLAKLNFKSTTLRKGTTAIGGRPAEELLESGKNDDKRALGFYGETVLQHPSGFNTPQIAIEMKMGGQVDFDYVDASLEDKEAVALWDAIVKSIRLRPGSV